MRNKKSTHSIKQGRPCFGCSLFTSCCVSAPSRSFGSFLSCYAQGRGQAAHQSPPRACGAEAAVRPHRARGPSLHRPPSQCPEPEFLLAAYVPVNSCTAKRRHFSPISSNLRYTCFRTSSGQFSNRAHKRRRSGTVASCVPMSFPLRAHKLQVHRVSRPLWAQALALRSAHSSTCSLAGTGMTPAPRLFVQTRDTLLFCWAALITTLTATQGVWITGSCPTPRARETGACTGRVPYDLSLNSFWQPYVPVNSCTSPRRRGKRSHQPEDVPSEEFGPDLPCLHCRTGHRPFFPNAFTHAPTRISGCSFIRSSLGYQRMFHLSWSTLGVF